MEDVSPEGGLLFEVELNYDRVTQSEKATCQASSLNIEQRSIYDTVLKAIEDNVGMALFVDGPGGTGKTYLYETILSRIRADGKIALAVASSGIAAILLPGGTTGQKVTNYINFVFECSLIFLQLFCHAFHIHRSF